MDKDRWAAHFKKKMEDYSEPLPEGLWERLEAEMSSSPKVVPMWRMRRFAVAVAAALVVSVSVLTAWLAGFWAEELEQPDAVVAEKNTFPVAPDEKPLLPSVSRPLSKVAVETPLLADARMTHSRSESPVQSLSEVDDSETVATPEGEESTRQTGENLLSASESKVRKHRRAFDQEQMQRNREVWEGKKENAENRHWSIGLNTGNMPFSSSNSFNGVGRLSLQAAQVSVSDMVMASEDAGRTAYNQLLFNNRDQTSKTEIHHKMPVTVGASFKWNFSSRWALETGLTYTLLSSDLRSGTDTYLEEEQKLHYIGVPVKLHRSLFDSRWISLYASAGGMVEKCVSASQDVVYVNGMTSRETEHHSLHIKEWQWSVTAAAGVQVNITPQIGLYAEPGIAYYFDDGSDVETIRKEHPLNFNLQVGLRFSLTK